MTGAGRRPSRPCRQGPFDLRVNGSLPRSTTARINRLPGTYFDPSPVQQPDPIKTELVQACPQHARRERWLVALPVRRRSDSPRTYVRWTRIIGGPQCARSFSGGGRLGTSPNDELWVRHTLLTSLVAKLDRCRRVTVGCAQRSAPNVRPATSAWSVARASMRCSEFRSTRLDSCWTRST